MTHDVSSDEVPAPIVRTARSLRALRGVPDMGQTARAAVAFSAGLGVAASERETDPRPVSPGAPAALPWGMWPRNETGPETAALLGSALARYSEQLRAKRAPKRQPAHRGLPILARRAGATRHGPHRGPGGLAASLRPVDQAVAPLGVDLRRKGV